MGHHRQDEIISKAELFNSLGLATNNYEEANQFLADRGLTNIKKFNIHLSKAVAAKTALKEHFIVICGRCEKQKKAKIAIHPSAKTVVIDDDRHCQMCGGSGCKRSFEQALSQIKKLNVKNLVIVGGFPKQINKVKNDLKAYANLKLVDGTKRLSRKAATPLIEKSDLIIIWCKTPVGHSATNIFKRADNVIYIHSTSLVGFYSGLIEETRFMIA